MEATAAPASASGSGVGFNRLLTCAVAPSRQPHHTTPACNPHPVFLFSQSYSLTQSDIFCIAAAFCKSSKRAILCCNVSHPAASCEGCLSGTQLLHFLLGRHWCERILGTQLLASRLSDALGQHPMRREKSHFGKGKGATFCIEIEREARECASAYIEPSGSKIRERSLRDPSIMPFSSRR